MEIDCGMNCFSPELNWNLGVDHHRPGLFSDCTDHVFGNTILMMSVWRAWHVRRTTGRKDISEGLVVVFFPSIITPESLDHVSHGVYLCLN